MSSAIEASPVSTSFHTLFPGPGSVPGPAPCGAASPPQSLEKSDSHPFKLIIPAGPLLGFPFKELCKSALRSKSFSGLVI